MPEPILAIAALLICYAVFLGVLMFLSGNLEKVIRTNQMTPPLPLTRKQSLTH